jgi:DNA polymerase elongation subunit (family B)
MKGFKRFTDAELRSYALGAISEEEGLAIDKIPLKKPTQWIWDNDPEILFRRNVNDVLILKALDEKYDLVEMFDDLRREFGALFHEVLLNYRVLDTALMRFVSGKIALSTAFKARRNKEKYLGAVVVEPVPGEYSYIAQFDFQREYPSLIKAFNIGPETYRDENYAGPCYTIEYKGAVFKFVKSPKSLLAQLIDFFFRKRDEYEGYYQKAIEAKDEVQIKAWYRKVFNIKKMTNAIYGVMDYPSFRLFRQECSAATAILGRIGIEQIAIILEPLGYKLIYGDTDSSFVPLKTKTEQGAVKEAQFLAEKINEGLTEFFKKTYGLPSAPTGLGVKKIYDSFLLIAKKNYAGRSFWDEKKGFKVDYDFKGLEVIRSDSSSFEKEVMEKIVRLVLDGHKSEIGVVRDDAFLRVSSRTLDPLMVSYPLQISHNLEEYPKEDKNGRPQMPSHVRAAIYSNKHLNTDFGRGDKPRRLPIKESDLKVSSSQSTLFKFDNLFPSECEWKGFSFQCRGISITEDSEIPEWFLERIDWGKIKKRLSEKIDKIIGLVKVEMDAQTDPNS